MRFSPAKTFILPITIVKQEELPTASDYYEYSEKETL
jgi:hypothetical protein